jgi:ferrous iron transport protein B
MELPPYRFPTLSGLLIHTWERTWQYIKKAGTIILAISILVWAAMSFPALPEDVADGFAAHRAFLQEHLAQLPYKKLRDSKEALISELEALPERDTSAVELQAKIAVLTKELAELPVSRLQAEIDALAEQLEKLPADQRADELREQMEKYAAALNALAEHDVGAEIMHRQLGIAMKEFARTPAGAIELMLAEKRTVLGSMPEKLLEARIQEIDHREAGAALRQSYAGKLGTALESITRPAGFDWRTNIALIGGIAAKEVVISTLGTVYSLGEVDKNNTASLADRIRADKQWTRANAVAMLLFTLLYSPCFVTLAVIKKESGEWKWMFFSLFFNLAFAYAVAVAANQLLRL